MTTSTRKHAVRVAAAGCFALMMLAACSDAAPQPGWVGPEGFDPSSDDAPPPSADEQARVRALLRAQGFDAGTAQFTDDGHVIVEGDIRMDARAVLAGGGELIEKGYYSNLATKPAFPAYVAPVTSGDLAISSDWQWAFFFAALDWDSQTDATLYWGNPPAGNDNVVVLWRWNTGLLDPVTGGPVNKTTIAVADWPKNGKIGRTVTLNGRYDGSLGVPPPAHYCGRSNIDTIPFELKQKVAYHELGHALGFAHPGEGNHIAGTAQTRASDPPYKSVMWQGADCPSYSTSDRYVNTLSSDDIASANAKL